MTNASTTPRFIVVAALLAGLLPFASVPHARAEFDGQAPTTGTKVPVPDPIVAVRDHRDRVIRDHRGKVRERPKAKPICAGWAC